MLTLGAIGARLEAACGDGTTPGAACAILRGGELVHRSWHGLAAPDLAQPVEAGTRWDLASLTKPMATTSVALLLHQQGLSLDTPVQALLPAFARAGKEDTTLEDLLTHRSGLPAWRPYWQQAASDPIAGALFAPKAQRPGGEGGRAALRRAAHLVREAVLAEILEAPRGTRAVYSDPGFMALGWALEAAAGKTLPALFEAKVAAPLGLEGTRFADLLSGEGGAPAAVTRRAPSRGGEILRGEVDDDNAFALGGVAGHAGLFSTLDDVARFGEALRRAHAGEASGPFAPEAVRRFWTRDLRTPGSTRTLGWDTPSAEDSHAGRRLSREGSFGHLGYTGCSLWVDTTRDLVVALLTNRVHQGEDPARIRILRAQVHDLAVEHLFP